MRGRSSLFQNSGRDLAGTISIEASVIKHSSISCGDWQLSIDEIRLIAEETDESGPWGEDWRIVFAASETEIHTASISANGMMSVLDALSEQFGHELQTTLVRSTSFASRILPPASSAGLPLFDFAVKKKWYDLIWPSPVLPVLTDQARSLLRPNPQY